MLCMHYGTRKGLIKLLYLQAVITTLKGGRTYLPYLAVTCLLSDLSPVAIRTPGERRGLAQGWQWHYGTTDHGLSHFFISREQ